MLSNISWQGYWTTLAVTAVLYYGFVFFLFFRKTFMRRVQGRGAAFNTPFSRTTNETQQPDLFLHQNLASGPADEPEYIPAVRSLVDEVHAFFESLDAKSQTKATLLPTLKTIIQKHPGVKGTVYQHSLNSLLLFLAEQNSSLHLSAEEVGGLWL